MTDYTAIPAADMLVGAKPKASTIQALFDNPIAITEGAAGAPRIQNAAIATGVIGAEKLQSGTAENSWVLARVATSAANGVGSYAFLARTTANAAIVAGTTYAGSGLTYCGFTGVFGSSPIMFSTSTLSGTWRAMASAPAGGFGANGATLFLRIA